MYQLNAILSIVSMCVHSCRYLIPFLKFILLGFFFCSWFYDWALTFTNSLSSRYISHFCPYIVITYPARNHNYTWLGTRSYLGPALCPRVWRISPTGTAEGNLHVRNIKLKHSHSRWTHPSTHEVNAIIKGCKASVWSYQGPYLQLQLSLSQLNPVCHVGETGAKYHHKSKWVEIVWYLCPSLFCLGINRHKDQRCGSQTAKTEPPCGIQNFLSCWFINAASSWLNSDYKWAL